MKNYVIKLYRFVYSFLFLTYCLSAFSPLLSAQITSSAQSTGFGTHDPVMMKYDDTYYLFATGRGISVASSTDLITWKRESSVFSAPLPWVNDTIVPGNRPLDIWAPDISFHNGTYYLYYSVSSFGKNTSAIGVATNMTLDPNDPDFKWIDHGPVVKSIAIKNDWNAIDPNLIIDEEGTPWLCFGSWWSGIKMVRLNNDLISLAQPEKWISLAERFRSFIPEDHRLMINRELKVPLSSKRMDIIIFLFPSTFAAGVSTAITMLWQAGRRRPQAPLSINRGRI